MCVIFTNISFSICAFTTFSYVTKLPILLPLESISRDSYTERGVWEGRSSQLVFISYVLIYGVKSTSQTSQNTCSLQQTNWMRSIRIYLCHHKQPASIWGTAVVNTSMCSVCLHFLLREILIVWTFMIKSFHSNIAECGEIWHFYYRTPFMTSYLLSTYFNMYEQFGKILKACHWQILPIL